MTVGMNQIKGEFPQLGPVTTSQHMHIGVKGLVNVERVDVGPVGRD